jgi:hypothetical protein
MQDMVNWKTPAEYMYHETGHNDNRRQNMSARISG